MGLSYINYCDIDGSNLIEFTKQKGDFTVVNISSDGTYILYNWYHRMDNMVANSIWHLSVDFEEDVEFTYGDNSIPISYSLDGTKILFASNPDGYKFGAFTLQIDNNIIERITPDSLYLYPICYSTSFEKILCQAWLYEGPNNRLNKEIYTINSDGTGLKRITFNPGQDYPVAFSPDDTKILFYSTRGREDSSQYWDIYIIKTDGTELRQLTNNEYRDYPLCFSPDGSKILFHSDRDGTINLFTMSVD